MRTMTHPLATAAASLLLAAQAAEGQDSYAAPVARTVAAIFEYSHWPQPRSPMILCVAGPARHASQIGTLRLADGRLVVRRAVAAQAAALAGCDAVYIGSVPLPVQRLLTAAVRGRGVLTISESDPASSSEAMFVLTYLPGGVSFRLNIDAVSRSGLRVDPRVLRVSRSGA